MNLHPVAGDRWTRHLEVVSVKGQTVRMRQGTYEYDMTLKEYMVLAAASERNGDILHRPETEDPEFE